jgi:hypothetical protein
MCQVFLLETFKSYIARLRYTRTWQRVIPAQRLRRCRWRCALLRASKDARQPRTLRGSLTLAPQGDDENCFSMNAVTKFGVAAVRSLVLRTTWIADSSG